MSLLVRFRLERRAWLGSTLGREPRQDVTVPGSSEASPCPGTCSAANLPRCLSPSPSWSRPHPQAALASAGLSPAGLQCCFSDGNPATQPGSILPAERAPGASGRRDPSPVTPEAGRPEPQPGPTPASPAPAPRPGKGRDHREGAPPPAILLRLWEGSGPGPPREPAGGSGPARPSARARRRRRASPLGQQRAVAARGWRGESERLRRGGLGSGRAGSKARSEPGPAPGSSLRPPRLQQGCGCPWSGRGRGALLPAPRSGKHRSGAARRAARLLLLQPRQPPAACSGAGSVGDLITSTPRMDTDGAFPCSLPCLVLRAGKGSRVPGSAAGTQRSATGLRRRGEGWGQGHRISPSPWGSGAGGEHRDAPGPTEGVSVGLEAEVAFPAGPALLQTGRIWPAVRARYLRAQDMLGRCRTPTLHVCPTDSALFGDARADPQTFY